MHVHEMEVIWVLNQCACHVLHGSAVLSYADAGTVFYLAGKLGTHDITPGEEQEIQETLRQTLCLEQGVPVAVGSG